jgi:hypothetical protein
MKEEEEDLIISQFLLGTRNYSCVGMESLSSSWSIIFGQNSCKLHCSWKILSGIRGNSGISSGPLL